MGGPLLEVRGLRTHFFVEDQTIRSVDDVSFSVAAGETLCIVGESGSGKSITVRSVLGLIETPGKVLEGQALWYGPGPNPDPGGADSPVRSDPLDLLALPPHSEALRRIRGNRIAMVFQEPMASLSPMYSVGEHLVEAIRLHRRMSKRQAWEMSISLLEKVGIHRPADRMRAYPFQLSGGMCQRVMIAMALCCSPSLLIADEPTTALDVTTQERVLRLLKDLQSELGMGMIFITHDLGVVAEIADDVVVMRRGKVVEQGTVDAIFHSPQHAYTQQLLNAMPQMTRFDALSEEPT